MPERIVIDANNETTLQNEYMLNSNNHLEIIKKYPNAGSAKVFIRANHPSNPACRDLLFKKDTELRDIITRLSIRCENRRKKSVMRTAIWDYYRENLRLEDRELDVKEGDTKTIWDKLQHYLPTYTLFQADRKNCDGDSEVQDPLKEAVKEILNDVELQNTFSEIAAEVSRKLQEVSERTLEKLREISPNVANTLNPRIPPSESLKWIDVFKNVSITGDVKASKKETEKFYEDLDRSDIENRLVSCMNKMLKSINKKEVGNSGKINTKTKSTNDFFTITTAGNRKKYLPHKSLYSKNLDDEIDVTKIYYGKCAVYLYKYIPKGEEEVKTYYLKILNAETKKQICDISISPYIYKYLEDILALIPIEKKDAQKYYLCFAVRLEKKDYSYNCRLKDSRLIELEREL